MTPLIKHRDRKIYLYLLLAWIVGCFVFFFFLYPNHLFHREQMQLFIFTSDYLTTYFQKPAWLSCLLGDFLTQFYYFIGGGPLIITLALLVLAGISFKALSPLAGAKRAFILALLVATLEVFRNTGMIYPLSSTISLAGGFFLILFENAFKKNRFLYLTGNLLFVILGYWMFGYGIWVFLGLLLISEWRRNNVWIPSLIAIITAVCPLFFRPYYLVTIPKAYTYPSTSFWNVPDFDREFVLSLDNNFYFRKYARVVEAAQQSEIKNPLVTYYFNLSNSQLYQLPDNLLHYYQPAAKGLFFDLNQESSLLAILFSNEVWFWLGDMTMAEHSAMLGQIFSYNGRSSRLTKRLAEINLVHGDTLAAEKHLKILSKTLLYSEWAASRFPKNHTQAYKNWLEQKRSKVNALDTLRLANDHITSLRNLLDSNPGNSEALDYLLCFHLLSKNISAFMDDYNKYWKPQNIIPKKIYAEAIMIYMAQKRASQEEVTSYYIPVDVVKDFWRFTDLYSKEQKETLQKEFNTSYCFYYQFATIIQR